MTDHGGIMIPVGVDAVGERPPRAERYVLLEACKSCQNNMLPSFHHMN